MATINVIVLPPWPAAAEPPVEFECLLCHQTYRELAPGGQYDLLTYRGDCAHPAAIAVERLRGHRVEYADG